jgi:hypothetical protein
MKITEHKHSELMGGPVVCLAWSSKVLRSAAEKRARDNPRSDLGKLVTDGRIKFRNPTSYCWMDVDLRVHCTTVEHGEKPPKFEVIEIEGLTVKVKDFAHFEWTDTRQASRDPLHVPLECDVTDCATAPLIGGETSILGPDGNRRAYTVVSVEPIEGGGWHIKIDPVSGSVGKG